MFIVTHSTCSKEPRQILNLESCLTITQFSMLQREHTNILTRILYHINTNLYHHDLTLSTPHQFDDSALLMIVIYQCDSSPKNENSFTIFSSRACGLDDSFWCFSALELSDFPLKQLNLCSEDGQRTQEFEMI